MSSSGEDPRHGVTEASLPVSIQIPPRSSKLGVIIKTYFPGCDLSATPVSPLSGLHPRGKPFALEYRLFLR